MVGLGLGGSAYLRLRSHPGWDERDGVDPGHAAEECARLPIHSG